MLENYVEVREWLESFIPLVYGKSEFGLARIENLLKLLGNPQKNFKSILVGGTAGKGSTAFYISRLLELAGPVRTFPPASAHSINKSNVVQKNNVELRAVRTLSSSATRKYKIGLHISPHLIYIGERMQINVREILVKQLVGLVNQIKPVVEAIGVSQPELLPSYFEILVALSFLYFAKEKVDWAVVEVGLGGRLDATNILESEISVITNIGLDHTELLGETVEKIAFEKAGIIKENKIVVTGATGSALKVIEKEAKSKNAILIKYSTLSIQKESKIYIEKYVFSHKYQIKSKGQSFAVFNKNLALLTALGLKMEIGKDAVKKAFSGKFVGRFEEIDKGVIVDGAHNADKMMALIDFVKNSQFSILNSQIVLVVAFKKGKKWQHMIDLLLKNLPVKGVIATKYFATTDMGPAPSERLSGVNKGSAVDPEEIANYVKSIVDKQSLWSSQAAGLSRSTIVETIGNSQEAVFEAIQSARKSESDRVQDLVLVTGSLYLVGEARTLWYIPSF